MFQRGRNGVWFKLGLRSFLVAAGVLWCATQGASRLFGSTIWPTEGCAVETWSAENGLPHNAITSITQTQDGYLWLGTEKGLVRFDGARFEVFDTWNSKELHSERISALHEDRQGYLWIGTKGGGVARYRGGSITHAGLSSQNINVFCEDSAGRIWVGTDGGGLFWWAGGKFTSGSAERGLQDLFVSALEETPDGTLWCGTRFIGLTQCHEGAYRAVALGRQPTPVSITALRRDGGGGLWVATLAGLGRFSPGNVLDFQSCSDLQGQAVTALDAGRDNLMWVGTRSGQLYRLTAGVLSAVPGWGKGIGDAISALYQDREGSLWVGTRESGLRQLKRLKFSVLMAKDGLSHDLTTCVHEDRQGRVWIGTYHGLNQLADGKLRAFGMKEGLPHETVTAIGEDRRGVIYIGTKKGLCRWSADGLLPCDPEAGWPSGAVWSIHEDRQGRLWLGTADGLYRRDESGFSQPGRGQIFSSEVRAIAEDREGVLWFGTSQGLAAWRSERFAAPPLPPGLLTRIFLTLHVDREGTLWCGTLGGGLVCLREGVATVYTMKDGLPDDTVYQIVDDASGGLWLAGSRGIAKISKADLVRAATSALRALSPVLFGKADGLASLECHGGFQPAACKTREGALLFTTTKGVAVVHPESLPINREPPPVILEEVVVDNQILPGSGAIHLGPASEKLEFHYTGLSFLVPEKVRFKYRLEGFNREWVEAGTRRVAYYTRPPPGRYHFQVVACNNDGVWNEKGASISLKVSSPIWLTWWFAVLVLAAILGTASGMHQWRVTHLRREQAAQAEFSRRLLAQQEAERKRIAGELHDSLAQDLLAIKSRAGLGLRQPQDRMTMAGELREISQAASHVLDEVRRVTYALRPYQLDRLGLTQAIRDFAHRAAEASELSFAVSIDDLTGVLPRESEIHLYRNIQESLNNVLKHAQATEVTLVVQREPRRLRVSVRDNGRGFSPVLVGVQANGFGLAGIAERVKLIHGTLAIDSALGQGTALAVEIALPESLESG